MAYQQNEVERKVFLGILRSGLTIVLNQPLTVGACLINVWTERYAEGKFIDLAGRRMHFVKGGHGKPVVLIHGFNLNSYTLIKNVDQSADRFKECTRDLLGQGYSTRQPLDYGFGLFEELIRLLTEHSRFRRPH